MQSKSKLVGENNNNNNKSVKIFSEKTYKLKK